MVEENKVKALLKRKAEEVPSVKSFYFSPVEKFSFKAGQYGFFNFSVDGKKYSKPFSFSSSPLKSYVRMTTIISGSEYKSALDSLEEGREIEIVGPYGSFVLDSSAGKDICFLAGGIGITPVMSMLEYLLERDKSPEMFLFYSNRTVGRIVFGEELFEMQKRIGPLKLINTITEGAGEEFEGETGYINSEMIERYVENPSVKHYYVVGPPAFNYAMKNQVVKNLGVLNERVTGEEFAGY